MNKTARNVLLAVAGVLLVSTATNRYLFNSVIISGKSMNPTLQNGDRGLINKVTLKLRPIRRGEIVIFHDHIDSGLVVKRVIGIPGDTITISFESVYLNGKLLSEPYLKPGTITIPRNYTRITLQPNEYFMMGDNRGGSLDSRNYGPIKYADILGLFVK